MVHKFKNKEQEICIEGIEETQEAKDLAVKVSAALKNAGLTELENCKIEIEFGMESGEEMEGGEDADEEIDEANLGMIGRLAGHEGSYEAEIIKTAKKLGITPSTEEVAQLLAKMKADKGQGQVMKTRAGKLFYKPSIKVAPHGAGNLAGGGLSSNN